MKRLSASSFTITENGLSRLFNMGIVYICDENCTIHKDGAALLVKKGGYRLDTVPLIDTECVIVFGNSQFSGKSLAMLFEKGIDLVYMSRTGKVKGRLNAEKSSNVILRIAQYAKWTDMDFRLALAKAFVCGKISNQLHVLEKYKKYEGSREIGGCIENIRANMEKLRDAQDLFALMGVEGACARLYFGSYTHILKSIGFEGRARRPAPDPVNALLNLSYAFLRNEIHSRLTLHSFDTELGFLHGIRYGRASLPLDVMEEFRPCFVDEFVITLFNKKVFKETDFETGADGCFLTYEALKKYCACYQEHLRKPTHSGEFWKGIFDRQVLRLRKSMLEGEPYCAYLAGN